MRIRSRLALVVSMCSALVATAASAQSRLDVSRAPNYGARNVTPGFTPDPIQVAVTSGGSLNVEAMRLGAGCRGFATAAPDFNFTLTGADSFLRVFVDAGSQDTTLIINRPDGSWVCADDTYGLNPGIDFNNAQPGVYNVWVGSYQASTRAAGTINITELTSVVPGARPAPTGAALDVTGTPNFGSRTLAPGFVPDPAVVQVVSGGSIDAETAGLPSGCTGWVTRQPDFNLVLTGNSPSLRVFVDGTARGQDVTLIINRADGSWICGDDSYGGLNPTIDLANATPGTYNVWVGSYRQGTTVRARLNITELDRHP